MSKRQFHPFESPYLVPADGSFRVKHAPTRPPRDARDDGANAARLLASQERLAKLQSRLMADRRGSLLVVLQAMDAGGKDGTVRAVTSGVNTAGVTVTSFKAPSELELDHDFLWRIWRALPAHGEIGIFNRSHYEEVLTVKVHPELLDAQRLPAPRVPARLWEHRFEAIRAMERHLARSGTTIVKLWLNVSRKEQKKRFIERVSDPEANWKFDAGDIRERRHWKAYMQAYEGVLNATSMACAPWYAIPADDKTYMRATVTDLIVHTLERMDPRFPRSSNEARLDMRRAERELARE